MENDIKLQIGQKISQLRIEKNLSVRKLAEMVGSDHSYLLSVEKGKKSIRIETLNKIVSVLGSHIEIRKNED